MKQATLEQPPVTTANHNATSPEPESHKDPFVIRPTIFIMRALSNLALKYDDRGDTKAAEKDLRKH